MPMLNIGAPPGAVPLGIAKGPPGAAGGTVAPVNENAGATVALGALPAGFDPAEKLKAGAELVAAPPNIPLPPIDGVDVAWTGVPNAKGLTVTWLLLVVALLVLKENDVLPVLLSKAGGGATVLLVAPEADPKLNVDALAVTGAAVELDPAEKLKLLDLRTLVAGVEELLPVLTVPIPPNPNGLVVADGAVTAEAPKENVAAVDEIPLD